MMEENLPRVSSDKSVDPTETKKRRKRKWDQPAEILSSGAAVPGIFPLGSLNSVTLSNTGSSEVLASTAGASSMAIPSTFQVPFLNPLAAASAQKINQLKVQDELIAREVVINDADSAVRYKLTKRQTQEEIQRCSGAIVITRGRYHAPNEPADNEKPLYLHISAGLHLATTLERIKAVDIAASMVEEILKQSPVPNDAKVIHPFSISVFLGFEANPSLAIATRIRGPNDQYVKHIMNETGATVVLRGHGSGNSQSSYDEEQQPLHLFLTSSNPQSLERAKLLAENLLDTISRDFGACRTPSKVYGAVPPPQQLASVQSSSNSCSTTSTLSPAVHTVHLPPISSAIHTGVGLSSVPSQPVGAYYLHRPLASGTSYLGYGGIYPQATPLQQVALALRQSPALINSSQTNSCSTTSFAQATTPTVTGANSSQTSSSEKEKRRRKFQESPAALKESTKPNQVFSLTLYEDWTISVFHRVLSCMELESSSGVLTLNMFWLLRFSHVAQRHFRLAVSCFYLLFIHIILSLWVVFLHFAFLWSFLFQNLFQGVTFLKPGELKPDSRERNLSSVPAPKKLVDSAFDVMPPPPPRNMPPPPPNFNSISSAPAQKGPKNNVLEKPTQETVPDTLIKLMEYGDDEDEDEDDETTEEPNKGDKIEVATSKPFWSV